MTDNWYVALIAGLFTSLRKSLEKNVCITWYDYNGYYISKNNVEIISKEIITYKSLLHIIITYH